MTNWGQNPNDGLNVEQGFDEKLKQFYSKGNQTPYLGSDEFRDWVYRQRQTEAAALSHQVLSAFRPSMDDIINQIADVMAVDREAILNGRLPVQRCLTGSDVLYFSTEGIIAFTTL